MKNRYRSIADLTIIMFVALLYIGAGDFDLTYVIGDVLWALEAEGANALTVLLMISFMISTAVVTAIEVIEIAIFKIRRKAKSIKGMKVKTMTKKAAAK